MNNNKKLVTRMNKNRLPLTQKKILNTSGSNSNLAYDRNFNLKNEHTKHSFV